VHHVIAELKRSVGSGHVWHVDCEASTLYGLAFTVFQSRRGEKGVLRHSSLGLEGRLRNHSFGSSLLPATIRMLAGMAQPGDFKAGEYLWKQGDRAEVLYLIDSG
jgi:hypothetical protein